MLKQVTVGVASAALLLGASSVDGSAINQNDAHAAQTTNQSQTLSKTQAAKIWLAGLPQYQTDQSALNGLEISEVDMSGQPVNPSLPDHSAHYPAGTKALHGNVNAAGHVVFKDNGDGTITLYDAPMHFSGPWANDQAYSERESQNILNQAKVVKMYEGDPALIDEVASHVV